MALSDETDPREAVRLMLAADASDSDYVDAGSQPDTIEVVDASPRKTKRTDQRDAIYVWTPADYDVDKMGAAGSSYRTSPVVQCEAWSHRSAAQAEAIKTDIINIVAAFSNDSQSNTQFVDVFPLSVTDFRHEHADLQGSQFVESVQVRLRRLASV